MDLNKVKENLEIDDVYEDLSDLFKILGDFTRTKILATLSISEMNVTDICEVINMSKSAVSHQLRVLRQAKLIKARKQGKEVYYSLDDEHVNKIYDCGLAHVKE
jgi:ArsR family transcriptional regulator